MIRVCIICEGLTEVEFVNRCLESYLRPSGVSAYGTVLSAKSGRHRGGRVTVDRLANNISFLYSEADRVTTLVDFYGFQDRAARSRTELEAAILAGVANSTRGYDPRFVLPYVQMYELGGYASPNLRHFSGLKMVGMTTQSWPWKLWPKNLPALKRSTIALRQRLPSASSASSKGPIPRRCMVH
jgi:hypothetical protein